MTGVFVALAALALVACLLDLVLTLGVIRRLREHTDLIAQLRSARRELPRPMLDTGESAGAFEAVATTGEPVSRDGLTGPTLVGAFSPQCDSCLEHVPTFVRAARRFPGGRDRVLAVVVGDPSDAGDYRERLEPIARVVVEPWGGAVGTALAIGGFPVFGVLDATATVVAGRLRPDQLDEIDALLATGDRAPVG